MNIETRALRHKSTNEHGEINGVLVQRPLVKIQAGNDQTNAKAICYNGRWFFEADTSHSDELEREWNEAK